MKNKMKKSYLTAMCATLAALLISVPLRIYQYFNIIEPQTGFYSKIDASVYVMYAVLAAAFICAMFVSRKKNEDDGIRRRSPMFLCVSIIMAIGVIVDSASQLIAYFELYSEATGANALSVSEYISAQGGTLLLLQAVFGCLSAVYFFVFGLTVGFGNSDGSKFRLFALVPVIWCIFRLLYRFKRTISFTNVSDLLLELFMLVFSLLFFLAYAQVTTKVDGSSVYWKLFACGLPASLFALVCFIPRFIIVVTGKSEMLADGYGVCFSDLTLAVFVAYNLISRARVQTEKLPE